MIIFSTESTKRNTKQHPCKLFFFLKHTNVVKNNTGSCLENILDTSEYKDVPTIKREKPTMSQMSNSN